jgi:hypothetical protein
MSEPSSGVPSEIADAEVEETDTGAEEPTEVTLDLDEEKLEAWNEIKSDYQVDPDGGAVDDAVDDETGDTEGQPDEPASDSAD